MPQSATKVYDQSPVVNLKKTNQKPEPTEQSKQSIDDMFEKMEKQVSAYYQLQKNMENLEFVNTQGGAVINYNFDQMPDIADEQPFSSEEQPMMLTANVTGRYPSSDCPVSDEDEEQEDDEEDNYQNHMTSPLQM